MSIFKQRTAINKLLDNNDNIKKIDGNLLEELQHNQLKMLIDINRICNDNCIDLILGGGTLLGAIRHKGFIPWDDDIDLNIQRKNVNTFIKSVESEYSDIYTVQYDNSNMICPFIKIKKKGTIIQGLLDNNKENGLCLDVFIIEDLPNNKLIKHIFGILCTTRLFIASCILMRDNVNKTYRDLIKNSNIAKINHYLKIFVGLFFRSIPYSKIAIDNDTFFSKYKGSNSEYVCIPTGRKHFFGELYKRELFEDLIEVEFEGIKCKAPKDYDSYLRNLYGDNYMEIPPVEKREHHYVLDIKL